MYLGSTHRRPSCAPLTIHILFQTNKCNPRSLTYSSTLFCRLRALQLLWSLIHFVLATSFSSAALVVHPHCFVDFVLFSCCGLSSALCWRLRALQLLWLLIHTVLATSCSSAAMVAHPCCRLRAFQLLLSLNCVGDVVLYSCSGCSPTLCWRLRALQLLWLHIHSLDAGT